MPYIRYSVPPPRPNFHGAVNMYAHPTSPPVLASPTSPPAWQQTYLPQKMPVMNQPPMHVSLGFHLCHASAYVEYEECGCGVSYCGPALRLSVCLLHVGMLRVGPRSSITLIGSHAQPSACCSIDRRAQNHFTASTNVGSQ